MGKYMNKSKIAGDVKVMEVFSQSSTVRTRAAKTLALQRLQKQLVGAPNPEVSSYLQLRSRRLEKTPLLKQPNKPERLNRCSRQSPKSKKSGPKLSFSLKASSVSGCETEDDEGFGFEAEVGKTAEIEASPGQTNLEFEVTRRGTRESTPRSRNPYSPTQYSTDAATNGIIQNDLQRTIATAHEMEEFFACAEQQQQKSFIEKYNYDIVNDKPLDGQYEWVKLVL